MSFFVTWTPEIDLMLRATSLARQRYLTTDMELSLSLFRSPSGEVKGGAETSREFTTLTTDDLIAYSSPCRSATHSRHVFAGFIS